jgi:hypothetical protein
MAKRCGRTAFSLLVASLLFALGVHSRADDQNLIELENARADYSREARGLKSEYDSKLKVLREKHRQIGERGRAAATKKGDLKLALAWEKLEKQLQEEAVNAPGLNPGEAEPKGVEKAWSEYTREAADLQAESKRKLRALKEKHWKTAGEGKIAATKKGDLKLALAWEDLERELQPKQVNLALRAKVTVNAEVPDNPRGNLNDGDLTGVDSQKYWYSGRAARKPDWALFELPARASVRTVRLLGPVGTRWHPNGHEPLDYEVFFKLAGKVKERVSVRGGGHQKREVSQDGRAQWIEVTLKSEVEADEVEFRCQRTTGQNPGPVLFEFEILGEE